MYPASTSELEIQQIGGEPLEGSGFEAQNPASEFELAAEEVSQ